MTPLELARKYMEIFFSGERLDELDALLSDTFTFRGPLYEFDSGAAFIRSLEADPPEGFQYSILEEFENETSACLIYQFTKPGISVPMAQQFEIRDGKISSSLLIFDPGSFT